MLSAGSLGSSFASLRMQKKTGNLQRFLEVGLILNFLSQNKSLNQFIEVCVWSGVSSFPAGKRSKVTYEGM